MILLGRLFNQGGAGGIIDKRQYLDQSKNLVTVNCLRFSQVILPCPRKPNSLFTRISASMYVCVCMHVYIYIYIYNIASCFFNLAFFTFILFSIMFLLFPFINYIFRTEKNQNFFFYIGILLCHKNPLNYDQQYHPYHIVNINIIISSILCFYKQDVQVSRVGRQI